MVHREKRSIVLFSGGIDSTACVKYYLTLGYRVRGVFVDYGQAASGMEFKSASRIASHYQIDFHRLVCDFGIHYREGEIRGRNALLVLAALVSHPEFSGVIALGIHSGTSYYDCSESFVSGINKIVAECTRGIVAVDAPFLNWTKMMIYEYCKEQEIPIHLTYSCEAGTEEPCGGCRSCLDRSVLDACKKNGA